MPELALNANVPIQIPMDVRSQDIPSHVQRMLQRVQEDVAKRIRDGIAGHLRNAMPVEGIDISADKMAWREI